MDNITINCITNTDGQTCTIPASDPILTPFFSSGDIMVSVLLFIIIILILIKFLKSGINTVSIIREYQGNNSPDGKEFYKI